MAEGKQSPRSRMIGMMYLVLTALLALQVSSAVINKFQDINTSLESGVKRSENRNQESLADIRESVTNAKNNAKDVAILKEAEEVRDRTKALLNYLDEQKRILIEKSGGTEEDGTFPGAKDEEPVAQHMIGVADAKNGEAYKMKEKLNSYCDYINQLLKSNKVERTFLPIAVDAKDDPHYMNDPDQRNKDFAQLNFESTPMVAALAIISEMEARVMNMEADALAILKAQLISDILKVDKIRPMVSTNTKYVVAGTEYEADMFMAAYSSRIHPKMTFDGKEIEVDKSGSGSIKFRASGGSYTNGLSKRTWTGTIAFPKPDGTDSVYKVEQEYFVVQPTVQVQGPSVSRLYRKSGNRISFQVPALGAQYNPTITATGADVIKLSGKGEVVIVPNRPNVKVKISNNGVMVGEKNFKVILVPTPTIKINHSEKAKIPRARAKHIKLTATADKSFAQLNPRDSRYKVTKFHYFVIRNGRVVKDRRIDGDRTNIGDINGERVMVEVLEVKRKNYMNQWVKAPIPETIKNINIAE